MREAALEQRLFRRRQRREHDRLHALLRSGAAGTDALRVRRPLQGLRSPLPAALAAVIPPQGEALSNMELFRRLAHASASSEPCFSDSDEDLARQALAGDDSDRLARARRSNGPGHERLRPNRRCCAAASSPHPAAASSCTARPWRRTAARACRASRNCPTGAAFHPGVTPASEQRVNSTFGGLPSQQSDLRCEIHPATMRSLGIRDGDEVMCCTTSAGRCSSRAGQRRRAPRHALRTQGRLDRRLAHGNTSTR
jgi:anaerobic selenocysteine-containing dehydrogenase